MFWSVHRAISHNGSLYSGSVSRWNFATTRLAWTHAKWKAIHSLKHANKPMRKFPRTVNCRSVCSLPWWLFLAASFCVFFQPDSRTSVSNDSSKVMFIWKAVGGSCNSLWYLLFCTSPRFPDGGDHKVSTTHGDTFMGIWKVEISLSYPLSMFLVMLAVRL